MLMAISQSELRIKANYFNQPIYESIHGSSLYEAKSFKRQKTAFLCHSHQDVDLVKGLLKLCEENELDVYIDWKDNTMPTTPNGTTASKIKEKIISNDIFLFLATENSKASRWCPWEIGYANSKQKRIYIVPTIDDKRTTYGNEYLELYSRIDFDNYLRLKLAQYNPGGYKPYFLSADSL
jgi:hypothetical protein